MELLPQLWLPIVVSAVVVFIASFLSWMVLPLHKKEWSRPPDEDALLAKLRELGLKPGKYMFPSYESREQAKSEAFQKKWAAGPHGILQIWAGQPNMGRNLALTFLFYLVTGFFVAYLAGHALEPGAEYLSVFRIVGVAALLAHIFAAIPSVIWFHKPAAGFVADLIDGVVYALLTAGVFAAFWPAA